MVVEAMTRDTMPSGEGDLSIEGHGIEPIPAAARYAPRRDRPLIYNMMFNTLDGLLAIGKQAKPIRREAVIEAVETFGEELAA